MALWVAFGLVLEPGEDAGSCTAGLRPGAYGDALVPAHLAAYLLIAGAIAWSHPPGLLTRLGLGASALVVLVSFASTGPIMILGIAGIVGALPAGVYTVIALVTLARGRGGEETARSLLWIALLVALPATFLGAYVNGAGLFCF